MTTNAMGNRIPLLFLANVLFCFSGEKKIKMKANGAREEVEKIFKRAKRPQTDFNRTLYFWFDSNLCI